MSRNSRGRIDRIGGVPVTPAQLLKRLNALAPEQQKKLRATARITLLERTSIETATVALYGFKLTARALSYVGDKIGDVFAMVGALTVTGLIAPGVFSFRRRLQRNPEITDAITKELRAMFAPKSSPGILSDTEKSAIGSMGDAIESLDPATRAAIAAMMKAKRGPATPTEGDC